MVLELSQFNQTPTPEQAHTTHTHPITHHYIYIHGFLNCIHIIWLTLVVHLGSLGAGGRGSNPGQAS